MLATFNKLRRILNRREKWQVLALLVAIIVMAFSQALGVASVLPFISLVMEPDMVFDNQYLNWAYELFNFSSVKRFIIFVGLAMLLIIVLANAVSALATWLKLRFVWMNNHRLSRRLLEKYLSMPYVFFLNHNSSDLSKNVLAEVNQLTSNYLMPLLNIITRAMIVLFILAMLFFVDVTVSLAAIVLIGGAYVAIYWRVNKNLKYRGEKRLRENLMRFKAVNEAFGGIKEIKVMNREPFFLDSYSKHSYQHALLVSWNAVIGQLPRFALEAIAFGGVIIFVLILLLNSDNAAQVIPIASVFAFAGYRLMPAIQEIFTSFTQMRFNQAVLDRIHDDITYRQDPGDSLAKKKRSVEPLPFEKEIKLNHVTYYYPNTKIPVIEDIDLSIMHNTSVAFVGPTGAGKTTLVDIILGLLTPQEGQLQVDDAIINRENLLNWQRNIGYVPQFIYLSDDTIARNIAFGLPDKEIDENRLEQAAKIADIYNFIKEELPDGFDTVVGERGVRLSGGQRQRIGIARALYHDPAVIVFDEATSALDGVTEEAVLGAMENAAKLKTLIIIAHRLTTVKNCDMVYMLDRGKITDQGAYDQLLNSNEQFRSMAKMNK
ncbi:MAG: ABC transporter ATP-binding protein [Bacillota bacterium]|nr:ABC transporter ATP-binding protein [Bacillota bacterium]